MSAAIQSPSVFVAGTYTSKRGRTKIAVTLATRVSREEWNGYHVKAKSLGAAWVNGSGWVFGQDANARTFLGDDGPAPEPVKLRVVRPEPEPEPTPEPTPEAPEPAAPRVKAAPKQKAKREFLPVPPPPPTPAAKLTAGPPTWAGNTTPATMTCVQVGATGRYMFFDGGVAAKWAAANGGEIVGATWLDEAAPAKPPKVDKHTKLVAKMHAEGWSALTHAERRELCTLTPAEKATFTAVTSHAAEEQKKHAALLAARCVDKATQDDEFDD